MKIRRATEADVPEMLALHREAVRQTGAGFYDPAVIEAWSASSLPENTPATIARMRQNLASGEVLSFVAEESGIIGFGELLPDQQVLGAIYVHPAHGRKGVGGSLMAALESLAKELGVAALHMDASLNAETFYKRHGFEVIEYSEHELRDGLKMPCVKMRKNLLSC